MQDAWRKEGNPDAGLNTEEVCSSLNVVRLQWVRADEGLPGREAGSVPTYKEVCSMLH